MCYNLLNFTRRVQGCWGIINTYHILYSKGIYNTGKWCSLLTYGAHLECPRLLRWIYWERGGKEMPYRPRTVLSSGSAEREREREMGPTNNEQMRRP